MNQDEIFMGIALDEAKVALKTGQLGIGACLVVNGKITSRNHNRTRERRDYLSHAEFLVLLESSPFLKGLRENRPFVTLYTTLEPCLMCFGAGALNRVNRIVYAAVDPWGGATQLNHPLPIFYREQGIEIVRGPFGKESFSLLDKSLGTAKVDNWRKMLRGANYCS